MSYHVNSIFMTIQGEGFWSGRPAVFTRLSRCNLWTGREKDRARAICQFCDTDFVDATKYEADELALAIEAQWPIDQPHPMVVFTGGEPMLQLDADLLSALRGDWYVAVETNGTIPIPAFPGQKGINWVCVSPKANAELKVFTGNELKLVYPQGPDPSPYLGLKFEHYWLSPMDGPLIAHHTALAAEYVRSHTQWRLNTQSHKQWSIP